LERVRSLSLTPQPRRQQSEVLEDLILAIRSLDQRVDSHRAEILDGVKRMFRSIDDTLKSSSDLLAQAPSRRADSPAPEEPAEDIRRAQANSVEVVARARYPLVRKRVLLGAAGIVLLAGTVLIGYFVSRPGTAAHTADSRTLSASPPSFRLNTAERPTKPVPVPEPLLAAIGELHYDRWSEELFGLYGMSEETFGRVLLTETEARGDFTGQSLRFAIREVQGKYGLDDDGRLGPQTNLLFLALWAKLDAGAMRESLERSRSNAWQDEYRRDYRLRTARQICSQRGHALAREVAQVVAILDGAKVPECSVSGE
jgi:hypothetical protein